ncbi:MAG: ubiquinol-cytochrome c reductase iron-sulfur subunit [Calditrichia bacterium]|nr:ubiquinol-cytochrome c reductase iron-sulfur subunit [Calditrichia bacterium]
MEKEKGENVSHSSGENVSQENSRRDFIGKLLMGIGVFFSFGLFAFQWINFIFPKMIKPKTRKIFAGKIDHYKKGVIKNFYDLEGKLIMVKRDQTGLRAFSSECPHLGCQVNWEADNNRFFCPCHSGIFDSDGIAIAGPPADAGQNLIEVPVDVEENSGIVYLEVKAVKRRKV